MKLRIDRPAYVLACAALWLAGCGGGNDTAGDGERGKAIGNAELTTRLNAEQLEAALRASVSGRQALQVAGSPRCGVDTRRLEYHTVGGRNEPTNATAAIMVPTGAGAACNGPRPVVLYGHGTSVARAYDLAQWTAPSQASADEGALVAAFFAAQGYVVVAPNYAGYAKSTLGYHP